MGSSNDTIGVNLEVLRKASAIKKIAANQKYLQIIERIFLKKNQGRVL